MFETMTYMALAAIFVLIAVIAMQARKNRSLADENRRLALDKARADERIDVMREQGEKNDAAMRERFAALAAETLQQNSKSLNEQSRLQIAELIAPMKANLEDFRKSYTDAYGDA